MPWVSAQLAAATSDSSYNKHLLLLPHSAAHSSEKILAVFRERAAHSSSRRDVEAGERLRKIKDELTMNLSTDNHTTLV